MARIVLRLKMSEQFKLGEFVKAEYAKSLLFVKEFAKLATEKLGFIVTEHHIEGVREALEIPNTREILRAEKNNTIADRLAACERAIGNLIRRVDVLEKS